MAEHFGYGMQVFDLTRLRGIRRSEEPKTVAADAVYTGVSNTHNLDINITARSPGDPQTTSQVDVRDLDSPAVVVASPNNTASTDHNLYVKDEVIYESN